VHALDHTVRHIVVADEDRDAVDRIVAILRADGHAVFHAYDALAATQLALSLKICDLVISNTKMAGMETGAALIRELRQIRPDLPMIYLANTGRSTPEVERSLPSDVLIVREPFTPEKLRAAVATKLDGA
jgi:CheY-like chemotaxis protein